MSAAARNHMELNLRDLAQLFNSMDPSPFHERDLDAAAETFIVDWARELPSGREFELVVRLGSRPMPEKADGVEEAVHYYFAQRAESSGRGLRRMLRLARWRLLIALLFMGACLTLGRLLTQIEIDSSLVRTTVLALDIVGWVALWRPVEIFLYDWWPLRSNMKLFERLSRMSVTVVMPEN